MFGRTKICFFVFLSAMAFFGCKSKEKAVWEDMKISDIPPARFDGKSGVEMVRTANFDVYVVEIPKGNFEQLDELWKMLNKKGIYLLDYRAFSSNSFQGGLGRASFFESIDKVLQEAGGRTINKLSLLIAEGESQDVEVGFLEKGESVFYVSTDGSMTGNTLGPGNIVIRLLAKEIPNLPGVSNVQFGVVFKPGMTTPLHALEIREERGEYLFTPVIFNMSLGSGDLVVLWPKKLTEDRSTLDGLFFGEEENGGVFRLYLILCTGVFF
jgi:hypothetical protein